MALIKLKKLLLSSLFLSLPFNSVGIFADEIFRNHKPVLLSELEGYRKHEDKSQDDNESHSIDHDWKNHYHTIRSIRLKPNGNLKIRFCEKVELLEGQVYADNVKYDVRDAYKIRKKSIVWRIKKKGTFKKGTRVFINTKDFLGRPIEKNPNINEIRSLERGCGLPFLYLPPGTQVNEGGNALGLIGILVGIGVAVGGSGSGGSGTSSSN